MPHITHMATRDTRHPTKALHMYTLEYRYKRVTNGRWTPWYSESQHDSKFEAIQALGQHVSAYETFSTRVVRYNDILEPVETVAEYKFK